MRKLKPGEIYCLMCKKIFKKKNLDRHDNSVAHEKMVLKSVNYIIKDHASKS